MDDSTYTHLDIERLEHGIVRLTINRPGVLNAADERLHADLGRIWTDIDADPTIRVAVVTGAGRAFSAGGDIEMEHRMVGNFAAVVREMRAASNIVYNMIECQKPIISAINGVAVGAGLAVALMADISIIGDEVRFTDGHLRLGVAAGDHSAIIWPLLCGMAKAKYYLLTADFIDGPEAERIGLVSRCVPQAELMETAMEVATKLATGPQQALRWTKRALNGWLRVAGPIFDASLGYEMLTFFDDDLKEGLAALTEKRPPTFPSASG